MNFVILLQKTRQILLRLVIEWILKFDGICRTKKKDEYQCMRRHSMEVEPKYQMNVVWIVWDRPPPSCFVKFVPQCLQFYMLYKVYNVITTSHVLAHKYVGSGSFEGLAYVLIAVKLLYICRRVFFQNSFIIIIIILL